MGLAPQRRQKYQGHAERQVTPPAKKPVAEAFELFSKGHFGSYERFSYQRFKRNAIYFFDNLSIVWD
jgi:hypothetical protein